jgi:heme-degrading monooxygenase HmoA
MHIQIVNFKLRDLTEDGYLKLCDEVAPAFADVPGLISKVWLADPDTNTYGGVYMWEDREAMESFQKTELYRGIGGHPNLGDVTSRDFAVLDEPTRVTRGLLGSLTEA